MKNFPKYVYNDIQYIILYIQYNGRKIVKLEIIYYQIRPLEPELCYMFSWVLAELLSTEF